MGVPWILIIMLSAKNGFGGNIEGGVAIKDVKFQTQAACLAARQQVLSGSSVFYREAYCVEEYK